VHEELRELYEADQGDRRAEPPPPGVVERDAWRRRRVAELLDAGAVQEGEDFHHAAMVFQHGDRLEDYWRAHELAGRAAELGYRRGRWLAAAAYDRWLMHQGRPQKYGTQYRVDGDRWVLHEVDPATTDAERAEWDVPPLAEARQRAERMSAERPPKVGGMVGAETLKVFRHAGLTLQIVRMPSDQSAPGLPPAEPLRADDVVPWLPEGLFPRRIGLGCVAVRGPDELVVGWHRSHRSEVLIAWRDEDGPVPDPEPVEVGGSPAIVCRGERGTWVLATRPDGQPWTVSGLLPLDELLRVAASLP
jgi:hypothetical protein